MKNIYNKIITILFAGFISFVLIFSIIFNYGTIITNLYENKDRLTNFSLSDKYFKDAVSVAESSYDSAVFMRNKYVDLYGGFQKIAGKSVIWDSDPNKTIVLGNDNKLYTAGNVTMNFADYVLNEDQLRQYSENISNLGKFVKQKNSDLIFVQAPARFNSDYVQVPAFISDGGKNNVDFMYDLLKNSEDLSVINLQLLFSEQNVNFADLFYRTDHHWNVKTAFWAYQQLCETFNDLGLNIDSKYYSISNYNIETLSGKFLGSIGERVGKLYAGADDFDFIYPKFDTDYVKTYSSVYNQSIAVGGGNKFVGDFKSAVFDYYKETVSGTRKVVLGAYVGGDVSETIIINNKAATNKKVLFIKDSYALPVAAFSSTCFSETRLIDLRFYTDGSAYNYIDNYNPDIVVVLYNPNAYNDTFFDFNK